MWLFTELKKKKGVHRLKIKGSICEKKKKKKTLASRDIYQVRTFFLIFFHIMLLFV